MPEVRPIIFNSGADQLVGLIHVADGNNPKGAGKDGVLIVVGGPQYRVGAHRQYVHLSRELASAGVHAMRFDYAGVGDSEGEFGGFEHVGADVRSAIDEMLQQLPDLENLYVWGLCDGASVALLHAADNKNVSGLVLSNPWVWSNQEEDRTLARHYYGSRFLDSGFWRALASGKVDFVAALGGFIMTVGRALRPTKVTDDNSATAPYQERMAAALEAFPGPIMLLLSGNDLVARDFEDRMRRDPAWKKATARTAITMHHIQDADHTFSQIDWKQQIARLTLNWIKNGGVGDNIETSNDRKG